MVSSCLELLVLHGVRVLGAPSVGDVARLYDLDPAMVTEHLLDAEAYGWARRQDWFGTTSWSLTERGKAENERQLSVELDATDARVQVAAAHHSFLPLNRRHGQTCTRWQLNNHLDERVDAAVLRELRAIAHDLDRVCLQLTGVLDRFGIHAPRYHTALDHLLAGEHAWLDAPDRPSCHLVWISLHEDLLATASNAAPTTSREVRGAAESDVLRMACDS